MHWILKTEKLHRYYKNVLCYHKNPVTNWHQSLYWISGWKMRNFLSRKCLWELIERWDSFIIHDAPILLEYTSWCVHRIWIHSSIWKVHLGQETSQVKAKKNNFISNSFDSSYILNYQNIKLFICSILC